MTTRTGKVCRLCGYRVQGPKSRGVHWLHRLEGWVCSTCYHSPQCDPDQALTPAVQGGHPEAGHQEAPAEEMADVPDDFIT